ncbi:MAG: ATP-binding cassette domain-containing protein [Saprospiraceae bacterium]
MIEASGIYKSYGSLAVLKGVNLAVGTGEVVSIVGRSGAGKSTLLHILGTLDSPDQGELRIKGEEVTRMSARKLAAFRNQHIGFIFQFHHLLPEFTALENVCIPAFIQQMSVDAAQQRAKELLDYLGFPSECSTNRVAVIGRRAAAGSRCSINESTCHRFCG